MTRTKTPARATKPAPQYIHEIGRTEHRIVMIGEPGSIERGDWFPHKEIATHGLMLAAHPEHSGVLPSGLFQVRRVGHLIL